MVTNQNNRKLTMPVGWHCPSDGIIESLTMPGEGSPLWKSWRFVLVNRQLKLTRSNEFYFYDFFFYFYYFCTVCNSKSLYFFSTFAKKMNVKKIEKLFFEKVK